MSSYSDYREYVTIQQLTTVENDSGGTVGTWSDLQKIYASVEPLNGSYGLELNRLIDSQAFTFKTWYSTLKSTNFDNSMRIVIRDINYNIHIVNNIDFKNDKIELTIYASQN